jgi:hypothetical protein
LTTDSSGLIAFWDLASEQAPPARAAKRQKLSQKETVVNLEPKLVIRGNEGKKKINRAIFDKGSEGGQGSGIVYSVGWDHTVKGWDLETEGGEVFTKVNSSFLSIKSVS